MDLLKCREVFSVIFANASDAISSINLVVVVLRPLRSVKLANILA